MNRRDFLKLVGAGAVTIVAGKFLANHMLGSFNNRNGGALLGASNSLVQEASAQTSPSGSWALGPDCPVIALHTALLPNGRLLLVQGSGNHLAFRAGPYKAVIFDPDLGTQQSFVLTKDLFCSNMNHLANGNILITGGTKAYDIDTPNGMFWGENCVFEFDIAANTFTELAPLAHGKWYPSHLMLPDGRVLNIAGLDEFGASNALTEVYNPNTKTHSIVPDPTSTDTYCVGENTGVAGSGSPCYTQVLKNLSTYSRMHLMPNGQVFICGSSNNLYIWNPSNGQHTFVGTTILPAWRDYGTSLLLPLQNAASEKGVVLIAGGNPNSNPPATNTAEILDFNASPDGIRPAIRSAAPMNFGRRYLLPIILPTGEVMVFGGTAGSSTDYIFSPEIYDPVANKWTLVNAPATVGRAYHGVALLLPDGRVWTGSSTPSSTVWEPRTEIYSPWYLAAGTTRPTISAQPTVGAYGGSIVIPTPDAANVNSVSLVRLGAATHHYDANMRLVWLQITGRTANSVTVNAPINANIAPPGPYMIHVLNASRVPSAARVIMIPGQGSNNNHPQIAITSPSAAGKVITGPSGGVPVTIQGTASDPSGGQISLVTVSVDSAAPVNAIPVAPGNWSNWSYTFTVTTRGPHTIRATAKNAAGSTTSVQMTIRVYPGA